MTFLVIGVNYRTDDHAVRFAASLARHAREDVSVVIVDNSERDDATVLCQRIVEANAKARCMPSPTNLGYFGGANYGLQQYLVHSPVPDWLLICNVDIEFSDDAFFRSLAELGSIHSLGVVAPRIWSTRWKRDLNPKIQSRPSKGRMVFYKVVFDNYYLQLAYESLSFLKNSVRGWFAEAWSRPSRQAGQKTNHTIVPIYGPHGSCMAFHRRFFAAGGNLGYSMFLFGEEIFVAETARKAGLLIGHCPQLWVLDHEHASTGIVRSRRVAGYMKEATNYLLQSYFA